MLDLFQLLSSQDVNWWTGVVWITCGLLWCFYQLFGLSFWRHPFTAEHPLMRHWCSDTFLQIWWRNKLILILDDLRVSTCSSYLDFCQNSSSEHQVYWRSVQSRGSLISKWSGMGSPVRTVKHLFHTLKTGQMGWEKAMSKVYRCCVPAAS